MRTLNKKGQVWNWFWLMLMCGVILLVYISLDSLVMTDIEDKITSKFTFDSQRANDTSAKSISRLQTTWNWIPWAIVVAVFFCMLYAAFTPIGGTQ